MKRHIHMGVALVAALAVSLASVACGGGQGPALDDLLKEPVIADGCPVGDELARKTVGRSFIATASVELTCGTNSTATSVFQRVDSRLGTFEGKTPWAGPVRLGNLAGVTGSTAPVTSGFQPSFYFWQPGELQVEVRILSGSEIPSIAQGYQTPYRISVSFNALH